MRTFNFKKISILIIGFIVCTSLFLLVGCNFQQSSKTAQDLYLGNIYTMNEDQPFAEAVTVANGKIQFVGSAEEAQAYCNDNTKVHDFKDSFIYPGFLEAHAHTMFAGYRAVGQANVSSVVPADAAKYKEIIKEFIAKHPEKDIYLASGWTEDQNPEINSAMLDEVCPDRPLILNTGSGHSVLLNKKAMEHFKINDEYVKKWGTELVRVDSNGKPTGYICENPAIQLLASIEVSVEDAKKYISAFQDFAFENGYTGVSDAGTELISQNATEAHKQLQDENKLKMRTYAYLLVPDNIDNPKEKIKNIAQYAKANSGEYFDIVGAKVFLDGVLEAHTSWLIDDYLDKPGYHGLERFNNKEKMIELIAEAAKNNLAVHAHSEGDGATKFFLDCIEEAQKISGNKDQRNAIAHLHFVRQEDIKRMADTNSIAVAAPLWSPKNPVARESEVSFVGEEKLDTAYPIKSYFDSNVTAAFHTDYPVSATFSAPMTVYMAATRSIPEGFVEGIGGPDSQSTPREAITREQALLGLTKNVAYMWHKEDKLGSIEVGKIANMSIVDTDLINDDIEMLPLSQIVATIIDGEEVFNVNNTPEAKAEREQIEQLLREFINTHKYDWDDAIEWYESIEY